MLIFALPTCNGFDNISIISLQLTLQRSYFCLQQHKTWILKYFIWISKRGILQTGSVNYIWLAEGSITVGKDQCVSSCCSQHIRRISWALSRQQKSQICVPRNCTTLCSIATAHTQGSCRRQFFTGMLIFCNEILSLYICEHFADENMYNLLCWTNCILWCLIFFFF